jgi:hypothetical protein
MLSLSGSLPTDSPDTFPRCANRSRPRMLAPGSATPCSRSASETPAAIAASLCSSGCRRLCPGADARSTDRGAPGASSPPLRPRPDEPESALPTVLPASLRGSRRLDRRRQDDRSGRLSTTPTEDRRCPLAPGEVIVLASPDLRPRLHSERSSRSSRESLAVESDYIHARPAYMQGHRRDTHTALRRACLSKARRFPLYAGILSGERRT